LKTSRLSLVTILITTIVAGVRLPSVLVAAQRAEPAASEESALLKGFAEIQPIDVHTHIYKDDPELNALIDRLNLRTVNICVIDDRDPDFKELEPQRTEALKVRQSTGGRVAFCTTFSPYPFEQPGFAASSIRQLNEDFAHGALAVKIYKVMGMEMKSRAGKWVMADDPAFHEAERRLPAPGL